MLDKIYESTTIEKGALDKKEARQERGGAECATEWLMLVVLLMREGGVLH